MEQSTAKTEYLSMKPRDVLKHWRRLNGQELIAAVIRGVKFVDGIKEIAA